MDNAKTYSHNLRRLSACSALSPARLTDSPEASCPPIRIEDFCHTLAVARCAPVDERIFLARQKLLKTRPNVNQPSKTSVRVCNRFAVPRDPSEIIESEIFAVG